MASTDESTVDASVTAGASAVPASAISLPLTLDLSASNLEAAPAWLDCHEPAAVERIWLYDNAIASLRPSMLAHLAHAPRLRELHLDHNLLTALPECISELALLEDLTLHSNRLESLPHSIGRLTWLRALRVDHNRLVALPDSICDCAALEALHLDGNRITRLPLRMGRLVKLVDLGIGDNPLEELPAAVAVLPALELVWFGDESLASIRNVPRAVLEAGIHTMRDYFGNDASAVVPPS
jgi:hypothetical protein